MTWVRRLERWSGWLIAATGLLTGVALTLPSLLPWHHPVVSRAAVVARTRDVVGPTASIATRYVLEGDLPTLGVFDPKGGDQGFWLVVSCGGTGCTGGATLMYLRDDQAGLNQLGLGPTANPAGFAKLPDRAVAEWLPSPGSPWWGTALTIAGCLLAAWMLVTRAPRTPGTARRQSPASVAPS